MKHLGEFSSFLLLVALHGLAITGARLQATAGIQSKRPATVADAIEMTRLGDLDLYWGSPFLDRLAHFSPDGKSVVVLARRGNLKSNTKDYSLLLWQTDELLHSPIPKTILTMSSSSNRQAIKDLRWLSDNETIAFLGEHPGELQQVYTYNIRKRQLKRITRHQTNVLSFSVTPDGIRLAYVAEEANGTIWTEKSRREGIVVSTQELGHLIRGETDRNSGRDNELFFLSNGTTRKLKIPTRIDPDNPAIWLSPNGKFILVPAQVQKIPALWKEYSDPEMRALISQDVQGQTSNLYHFVLIDTSSGESKVLLDSPLGAGEPEAAWSPDGHSVVINHTYLPLEGAGGEERKARQSSSFAIEVHVLDGGFSKMTDADLILLGWDTSLNLLRFADWKLAHENRPGAEVFFRKDGENWDRVQAPSSIGVRPKIVVDEDLNNPPKLFATDPEKSQKVLLFDLNPQFTELKFAKVEQIHWKGSDGHDVIGGLYYPVDFMPGRRYPLVIQSHGWMSEAFWIDGPFTTAFAAQPLAGKGVMVLQGDEDFSNQGTPLEVAREVSAFEGAIDYLDNKGLIDRDRVGIMGFSRTCLLVKYALTHSKYHFAAASVTDGVDGGYFQYIAVLNAFPAIAKDSEGLNGGPPFAEGLKSWVRSAPDFAIDNVHTPVRITALNPLSILWEWEWFAALSRLRRPVEMIAIQDGDHILQKPWDRMVSQQGNVDWFRFWLKGEEDPDSAKVEQYKRWRELRKLQEAERAIGQPN